MASGTFVEVIVPVPVSGTFYYRVPENEGKKVLPGMRVVVPFGNKKTYTAIVVRIWDSLPEKVSLKDVLTVPDEGPIVSEIQFHFWRWIADYYLCTVGEVLDAALPGGLKPQYRQRLFLKENMPPTHESLDREDLRLLELLKDKGPTTPEKLSKLAGSKKTIQRVDKLVQKGYLSTETFLDEKYKPRKVTCLSLSESVSEEKEWLKVLDTLGTAPRQKEILLFFLESWKHGRKNRLYEKAVIVKKYPSPAAISALIKKRILEKTEKEVSRLETTSTPEENLYALSKNQGDALSKIRKEFTEKDIVLLHGITSSGKTEIYFHLIREVLDRGAQVLYLLPEIAITSQMIQRLKRVFGPRVFVFHSRYPEQERIEIWHAVAGKKENSEVMIVLGVRSAIFLPFTNLGLVIVDEEHETTYKQQQPAPRYHARDMAVVLAQLYGAKVLMGTATPSLESYYNARRGKYGLVTLNERYTRVSLPAIRIVDMKKSYRRGEAKGHLSAPLYEAVKGALHDKEQVILFQNRRGFSPFLQCNQCGWIPYCRHCDVRLTYHREKNTLVCHYCGYTLSMPDKCHRCHSTDLKTRGFGTEKVEHEVNTLFPEASILRLDLDTTRTRADYFRIISKFEAHQADILIGTQMVTKGLDFEHVQVVGILNADNLLHFPDFRAWERSFQLMTQVSGRAGRSDKQGMVFIQTWDPDHPVIQQAVAYNYMDMYRSQLAERKAFGYPPFYRLIIIHLKHRNDKTVNNAAHVFAQQLKKDFPGKVLGPETPPVARVRNLVERKILLKIHREANLGKVKEKITQTGEWLHQDRKFRSVRIFYDVDPV